MELAVGQGLPCLENASKLTKILSVSVRTDPVTHTGDFCRAKSLVMNLDHFLAQITKNMRHSQLPTKELNPANQADSMNDCASFVDSIFNRSYMLIRKNS
jgi:hypothetical protein